MHFKGRWRLSCHQKIVLRKKLIEMISKTIENVTLQTNEKPLEPLLEKGITPDMKSSLKLLNKEDGITAITIVNKMSEGTTGKLKRTGIKGEIKFLYSRNKDEIVLCIDELLDTNNIEDDTKADSEKLLELYKKCLENILVGFTICKW